MNAIEGQINQAYNQNIIKLGKNIDYNMKTGHFIYKKEVSDNKTTDKYYNKKILGFEGNCHFVREGDEEVDKKRKIALETSYKIAHIIGYNEAYGESIEFEDFIYNFYPKFIFDKKDSNNAGYIYDALNRIEIIKEECFNFLEKHPECNFTKAVSDIFK